MTGLYLFTALLWFFLSITLLQELLLRSKLYRKLAVVLVSVSVLFHTLLLMLIFHSFGHGWSLSVLQLSMISLSWAAGVFLVWVIFYYSTILLSFILSLGEVLAFLIIIHLDFSNSVGQGTLLSFGRLGHWLGLHIMLVFLGFGGFTLSMIASTLFLILDHRLKKKKFGTFLESFASLEELGHLSVTSVRAALWVFIPGLLIGLIFALRSSGTSHALSLVLLSFFMVFLYALALKKRQGAHGSYRVFCKISIYNFFVLVIGHLLVLWLSSSGGGG